MKQTASQRLAHTEYVLVNNDDDRRRYHRRQSFERRQLIRFDLRNIKRRSGDDRRLTLCKILTLTHHR